MQQHSAGSGFWDDPKEAEAFLKKMSGVKFWTDAYDELRKMDEDLEVLLEFAREDESAQQDADAQFEALTGKVEDLELRNMLGEEGDNLGAILKINSGAGGTESNDWSAMLMRMYVRWGERNGYKVAVSDLIEGDEAGIKSVTIEFEGDYAFGYLKGESGVHRLVRISPFNAQGKRQTTFSSDDILLRLRLPSRGRHHRDRNQPGRPRVGHLPLVRSRRPERQQGRDRRPSAPHPHRHSGREHRDPLPARQQAACPPHPQVAPLRPSQIRSYVLHPYKMVKDLRTGYETSDTQGVLDGDLNAFMKSFLMEAGSAS